LTIIPFQMAIQIDTYPIMPSGCLIGPFDKTLARLRREGFNLISLEDNARLRIAEGSYAPVSKNGNFVSASAIYNFDNGFFISKRSPILAAQKEAIECQSRGEDFLLTDELAEWALEDAVEVFARVIPSKNFGEEPVTSYLFGKAAKDYGEFLTGAGVKAVPIWRTNNSPFLRPSTEKDHIKELKKPFARQIYFSAIPYWSGISCDALDLGSNTNRLRGYAVLPESIKKLIKK